DGVEPWTPIRAIQYLAPGAAVDPTKIGVTGRSGGGAYSSWTAALDDRIACAVPVAGITDMHNHIVDGTIDDVIVHVGDAGDGDSAGDAIVESGGPRGISAAAGAAGDADFRGIDCGARGQILDRAYGGPGLYAV